MIATCDPIFTTATATPLQFPLQTFIIAPCPITAGSSLQATALTSTGSQGLARITNILPSPMLAKGLEHFTLPKIPIKSLLKPKPKVIWRRKRKKKNATIVPSKEESETASVDNLQQTTKEPSAKENEPNLQKTVATHDTLKESEYIAENNEPQGRDDTKVKDKNGEISDKENANENILKTTSVAHVVEIENVPNQVEAAVFNQKDSTNDGASTSKLMEVIDTADDRPSAKEMHENILDKIPDVVEEVELESASENIPVLRIIEASSAEVNEPSNDILASVVIESSGADQGSNNNTELDSSMITEELTTPNEKEIQISKTADTPASSSNEAGKGISLDTVGAPEHDAHDDNSADKVSDSILPESRESMVKTTTVSQTVTSTEESMDVTDVEKQKLESSSSDIVVTTDLKKSLTMPTIRENQSVQQPLTEVSSRTPRLVDIPEEESTETEVVGAKSMQTDPQPLAAVKHILSDIASSSSTNTELSVLTTLGKQNDENIISNVQTPEKRKCNEVTTETASTTDKISECIARSIDLIDANDSELMELGEHWEDNGASPKSISPTQIFLNMFPLLPRDSSAPDLHQQPATLLHHHQHQQPSSSSTVQTSKSSLSFLPSSNCRSSFFIDAMLPDDHSGSNNTVIPSESTDTNASTGLSHSPFLPLTPPQYSSNNQQMASPFSLSNSYYWTPSTVPSSTITEISSSDFRSSYNSSSQPIENQRTTTNSVTIVSSSSSNICATTSTSFQSSPSKVSNSENHRTKRPKTASSGGTVKVSSTTLETSLPSFSKDKGVSSTTIPKTTAPSTSVTVTWCLSTPTQSTTFQQTNTSALTPIETNSEVSHHPCSILDSLNPIDAAFFRPLINALDNHDFRGLEFPGSTTLPPPPPPLPLIPPPPTKPLYSSQFAPNSQSIQNSVGSTSYHDHSIQGSFIHHPQQPVQFFGTNIQQLTQESINPVQPSASCNAGSSKQTTSTHTHRHSSTTKNHAVSRDVDSTKESSDKTSRTSGRQKSESTKKSRAGKSSRTQPYVVPSPLASSTVTSGQSQSQGFEQGSTSTSAQKATHSYSIHTIQSHINPVPSKATRTHSNRNIDFQMENIQKPPHFQTLPMQISVQKPNEARGGTQGRTTERAQPSKKSESKSQKSKEEKTHNIHVTPPSTVKQSKSSRTGYMLPPSSSSHVQQANDNVSVAVASSSGSHSSTTKTITATSQPSTASTQLNIHQEPPKSSQSLSTSNVGFPQAFNIHHSSAETFQLFPEFSVGASSRQFPNSQSSVHHYHADNGSQSFLEPQQQQQEQQATVNNFHTPRSHPYYFSDLTGSLESFSQMPVHQPQPNFSTNQVYAPTEKAATNPNCNPSSAQRNEGSNSKFTIVPPHTPNLSNNQQHPQATSIHPQQDFQVSTQQYNIHHHQQNQQRHSRQHQNANTVMHHEASHSRSQAVPTVQQAPSVSNQQHIHAQQRQHVHQPSCPQSVSHNRNNPSQPSTPANVSVHSGKGKHTIQTISQQSVPTSQHNQQSVNLHHQQTPQQQQQQQHASHSHYHPSSRPSSSKTVNWMTDTGYRPTTSSSSTTAIKSQRQSSSNSTSNPFPVSKLVGTSSASTSAKSQPGAGNNVADTTGRVPQQQQQQQSSQNNPSVRSTKQQPRSTGGGPANNAISANTINQPQGQSIYCAEALIRKNPPSTNEWTNEFNLVPSSGPTTNQGPSAAQGYPIPHQHSNQNLHVQQHTSVASEQFPNWNTTNMSSGTYNYGSGGSHSSTSNQSQFTHFDHSQYQTTQHHHHNNQQHHQPPNQNISSSSYNPALQTQRHNNNNIHSHSSSQNQSISGGHVNYPQHHHSSHHHQHHQSSTSSVTNFNLSTIFPEINDKRNNNGGGQAGRLASGNNASGNSANVSGNTNAPCGYHQIHFGNNQPGSSGNLG